MKKCKGILALLLSVMITLTFTPSIAFAGNGDGGDPEPEYAVMIGSTGYNSLKAAIAAVETDGTAEVILQKDFSCTDFISYSKKNIVFDLNGHSYTRTNSGAAVQVSTSATFTVKDSAGGGSFNAGNGIGIETKAATAVVNIQSGTVTGTNYGISSDSGTVTVSGGEVTGETVGIHTKNGNITVSGGTVTGGEQGILDYENEKPATITVSGGTIKANGTTNDTGAIILYDASTLTVSGGDTKVIGGYSGIVVFDAAEVTISEGSVSGDTFGITGNGSGEYGGYTINVDGGTVSASDGVGIYHPNDGTVNITGGTVTGKTAVYQKSGTLAISGGTITGTGAKADYSYNGNGANATGDAIVIDSCGYPGGAPQPAITGGTFESANAKAVASYSYGEGNEAAEGFVAGGSFNGQVPDELCADGFICVENADGTYGVEALAPIQYYYTWSVPSIYYFEDEDPVPSRTTQGTVPTIKREGESSYHAVEDFVTLTWTVTASDATDASTPDDSIATVDENGLVTFTKPGKVKVWLTMTDAAGTKSSSKDVSYAIAPVAVKHGDTKTAYGSVYSAFNHAEDGDTIVLGKDANANNIGKVELTTDRDLTLDLNGHSINFSANYREDGFGAMFNIKKGSLTVVNSGNGGGIFASGTSARAFNIDGKANSAADEAVLTISEGVAVSSAKDCCVTVFGKGTLNTAGDLTSPLDFAIAGNGSEGEGGYIINVTGGSVTSESETAIYHPNSGTVTVSGGTITGTTAIYQKAGELNITGGSFIATGEAADYTYNGNGANATGDAIVIDSCGYPGGAPQPAITGGTFESANAKAVASYSYGEGNEAAEGFVAGGSFNGQVPDELCADGFICVENADGTYGVEALAPIQYYYTWSVPSIYYFEDEDPVPSRTTQGTVPTIKREGESSYHAVEDFVTLTWTVTASDATDASTPDDSIATVDENGLVTFTKPGKVKVWLTMTDAAGTKSSSKDVSYAIAPVAVKHGDTKTAYGSVYSAFNHAEDGDTIVLGKDANANNIGKVELTTDRDLTLDLNGHSINFSANYREDGFGAMFNIKKGSLTVVNSGNGGGIFASGTSARAFNIDGKANSAADEAVLTISEGVAVSSAKDCCVTVFGKGTLNTAGDLTSPLDFAIAGNGSEGEGGYIINVTGGSVTSESETAIYHPNSGTVTVSGGTITGTTAIYQKAGELNITGGSFIATGEAADYTYNGNGANATGDAIVIDSCGYPGGAPQPAITGGTFESANADAVASYTYQDNPQVNGFVAGGLFSTPVPADYCTAAFVPSDEPDENGLYGVIEKIVVVKTEALAELNDVNIEDYVEAHQYKVHRLVEIARNNVENAASIPQLEAIMNSFRADLAEYTTLAEAKAEAKAALANYKKDVEFAEENARAAIVENGQANIDAATTSTAIYNALNDAKAAIDALQTKLEKAKATAKAELKDYKDPADYRDAEKVELRAIKAEAREAIDAATTVDEVDAALAAAKTEIDELKTAAQYEAEEAETAAAALAQAKADAKAALEGYKDAADYRDTEKTQLATLVNTGKSAIDEAADLDAVEAALAAAKTQIDQLKTKADYEAEEAQTLAAKKAEAKAALDAYKNPADYRDAEKVELRAIKAEAREAIDAATTTAEVDAALAAAKDELDDVKTAAQYEAEEAAAAAQALADAKAAAMETLNGIDSANYRDEVRDGQTETDKAQVEAIVNAAKADVNAATSAEQVAQILAGAANSLKAIPTDKDLSEEEASALKEAQNAAVAAINAKLEAAQDKISDADKSAANTAAMSAKIDALTATTPAQAEAAAQAFSDIIDQMIDSESDIDDAKAAAIAALDALVSDENLSKYRDEDQKTIKDIVAEAKAAVNSATTSEAVNQILANAQTAASAVKTDAQRTEEEGAAARELSNTKTAAIAELNKINLANYIDPERSIVQNTVADAKKAIESAKNVGAVNAAVAAANNTIKAQGVFNAKLPKVTNKKPTKGKKKMTVKWKKLSKKNAKKVTGIEIQYAENNAFTQNAKMVTVKKTKKSKKIKKLVSKKTYWVRVRTYKNTSTGKLVGGWSKVKAVKVK